MSAITQKLLSSHLFQRPEHIESPRQIISWWETRRLFYNLIVGTTGIVTCVILFGIAMFSEKRFGEPIGIPDPPLFGIIGIFAYGIAANICYTGGWIGELFARSVWKQQAEHFGKIGFVLGIAFSVLLTLTPVIVCSAAVVLKMLGVIS